MESFLFLYNNSLTKTLFYKSEKSASTTQGRGLELAGLELFGRTRTRTLEILGLELELELESKLIRKLSKGMFFGIKVVR